jgi:hypothetical protein
MPAVQIEDRRGGAPGSDDDPGPPGRGARALAVLFPGDRRVWRAAAIVGLPLVALIAVWCLVPRPYYTGTNSVEDLSYVAQTPVHQSTCVPGLEVPAGTARVRFRVISQTRQRPSVHLALSVGGRTIRSDLPPTRVEGDRISDAIFAIPQTSRTPAAQPASACLTADGLVNWGGTPSVEPIGVRPTVDGRPISGAIAVWYLPRAGSKRSYVAEAGTIFHRAAMFRPGIVGSWTYPVLLFVVLPALALLALRLLALAVAGRTRGLAVGLFVVAALNAGSWALITPPFHGPDEVDHFAYTQSLVERHHAPSRDPSSPLQRWSSSESAALTGTKLFTDHQKGDTKAPWLAIDEAGYRALAARSTRRDDGGGNETAATHGPLYYLALAPAYLAARHGSIFAQLTLMRLASALIGALTVLFTYLLARELAPGRPWLAVLAALLVAFEPMYGFISGIVNNDVGVNAGAAAMELLLIRALRRGVTVPWGLLTGALLILLPIVKGTAYSLYPVAALVLAAALWRHHGRRDWRGWGIFALVAIVVRELSAHLSGVLQTSAGNSPGVGSSVGATAGALHHPLSYLVYLWEVFLPRLPFMARHFVDTGYPAYVIFDKRGWGAFGWYVVLFPGWVYVVILVVMLATPLLGLLAARGEWAFVRRHALEAAALILFPVAVILGFEAAFYTESARSLIAEFGRYVFPAIGPLAILVVASLHAFGRRRLPAIGTGLLVALLALSYASQLLTLTAFFA